MNLASGNGHSIEISDISFALQCFSLEYIAKKHDLLPNTIIDLPEQITQEVAFLNLNDCTNSSNREILNKYILEYPDIQFIYVDNSKIIHIYDQVKEKLNIEMKEAFLSLYPNGKVNYGNTFNKIFIFAMLLGSKMIFRRDSDVHIKSIPHRMEKYLFPIDIELKYLSKQLNGKPIYIIGGGYSGKWGLDIDPLIKNNDLSLLKELIAFLPISADQQDEFIKSRVLNNDTEFEQDDIIFNSDSYSECGNCSYYKLFEYIPCSPSNFVLGTDYFLQEVSLNLGMNVGYHNRTVIHKHTIDRYPTEEKLFNYWLGIAMYIDLKVLYTPYYEKLYNLKDKINNNSQNLHYLTTESLMDFENYIPSYYEARQEKVLKFAAMLGKINEESFNKISKELCDRKLSIIEHKNIKEHINLLKIWRNVNEILSDLRNSENVRELVLKNLL